MIRKIKMWYWKKFDTERYYEEIGKNINRRLAESLKKITLAINGLHKAFGENTCKDD